MKETNSPNQTDQELIDQNIAPAQGAYAVVELRPTPGATIWWTNYDGYARMTFQAWDWPILLGKLKALQSELGALIRDVERNHSGNGADTLPKDDNWGSTR